MNDFKIQNYIYELEDLIRDLAYYNDGAYGMLIYELDKVKDALQDELDRILQLDGHL